MGGNNRHNHPDTGRVAAGGCSVMVGEDWEGALRRVSGLANDVHHAAKQATDADAKHGLEMAFMALRGVMARYELLASGCAQ